jgi:hypothetical protein
MNMLHDLNETLRDVLSLAGDWMKYKLSAETDVVRNAINQVILWLGVAVVGFLLILTGAGFLIAGLFWLLALAVNPWASALIVGGSILLIAIFFMLIFKALVSKR